MTPKYRIAAITDEFSPDLEKAVEPMSEIGMTGAELRVLWGKNIMDLSDEEIRRARQILADKGMEVISIASPILKCVLPGGPGVDTRFQQDIFNSKHTFEDQPRLAARAFDIAEMLGCKIIRVFSYWRTVEPKKCLPAVVEALDALAKKAAKRKLIIGLENEHACNIATAAEAPRALGKVKRPSLKLVCGIRPMRSAPARIRSQRAMPKLPKNRIVTCT
ncbi:MAG: TIM barrel protein [Bryobacteraceae bacterium]